VNWHRVANWVFPYIEPLTAAQKTAQARRLQEDRVAIQAANWARNEERALDEVQKVAAAEMERVRTAEGKATTYLAVLAALVPVIITLQAANWEKKAGPAPDAARLFVLTLATVYVAAAGYHAFMTLQVRGFQKVGESEIVAAWRTPNPLSKLIRGTLLATRSSRDVVNEKVTRIANRTVSVETIGHLPPRRYRRVTDSRRLKARRSIRSRRRDEMRQKPHEPSDALDHRARHLPLGELDRCRHRSGIAQEAGRA
jgi:hypothetical protein